MVNLVNFITPESNKFNRQPTERVMEARKLRYDIVAGLSHFMESAPKVVQEVNAMDAAASVAQHVPETQPTPVYNTTTQVTERAPAIDNRQAAKFASDGQSTPELQAQTAAMFAQAEQVQLAPESRPIPAAPSPVASSPLTEQEVRAMETASLEVFDHALQTELSPEDVARQAVDKALNEAQPMVKDDFGLVG